MDIRKVDKNLNNENNSQSKFEERANQIYLLLKSTIKRNNKNFDFIKQNNCKFGSNNNEYDSINYNYYSNLHKSKQKSIPKSINNLSSINSPKKCSISLETKFKVGLESPRTYKLLINQNQILKSKEKSTSLVFPSQERKHIKYRLDTYGDKNLINIKKLFNCIDKEGKKVLSPDQRIKLAEKLNECANNLLKLQERLKSSATQKRISEWELMKFANEIE